MALNLYYLALTLQLEGHRGEAITLFRESIEQFKHLTNEHDSRLNTAYIDLARTLREQGDKVESESLLRKALANTDTLRITPGSSGVKSIEIANVVSLWRSQKVEETPRALVLLSVRENSSPLEARFFSAEASPELRPRLRISYSARKATGLP